MEEKLLSKMPERYWFHIHTNYTDGELEVEEYFELAQEHHIDKLVFLEHIRTKPNYDVEAFFQQVKRASKKHQVDASVGFEAKILPSGQLDISSDHFSLAEIIGIAEHGFPNDVTLFLQAFESLLSSIHPQRKQFVWVHPGLFFRKAGGLEKYEKEYQTLLDKAESFQISIEHNLKYDLIQKKSYCSRKHIVGIDAHNHKDINRWKERESHLKFLPVSSEKIEK